MGVVCATLNSVNDLVVDLKSAKMAALARAAIFYGQNL